MTCDLFLRTHQADFRWLDFLFRSLARHVRGFRNLLVMYPCNQVGPARMGEWGGRLIEAGAIESYQSVPTPRVYPDDYVGQQISKLRSWEYTDADEICFLDSDIVFVRDFTPMSLHPFHVECRPWEAVGRAQCWYPPTKILLRADPQFETMARHPFQYSRSVIRRCYEHVGGEEALLGFGAHFSEFNLLGNYAILREGVPHRLVGMGDSTQERREDDWVQQFWSWGGLPLEVETKLRQLGLWEDER